MEFSWRIRINDFEGRTSQRRWSHDVGLSKAMNDVQNLVQSIQHGRKQIQMASM